MLTKVSSVGAEKPDGHALAAKSWRGGSVEPWSRNFLMQIELEKLTCSGKASSLLAKDSKSNTHFPTLQADPSVSTQGSRPALRWLRSGSDWFNFARTLDPNCHNRGI
ncbi:hypothetical protein TWF225_001714 [Orbilia oligospora]|uniref:Uncharacterized protein n=1 Tax=Orbilia oligospora TaxID=2813651 RepID=A0A7C8JVS0_ORBOL|nr:hypothetical protein TWF751_003311 [Orbilia oligospora]KAF3164246.1 hypothetical protein TWF225_001714 [Orbilia oligospora]KAF3233831.1 hypothetical protein TWF128_002860 [Orbilia oligospora]KAF3234235.1 hypothetical protein TWF217_003789 [Orbilia oligospora]KAF3278721.1 hypothetical protein TWF132_000867 [Orbilia oligospora]